MSYRLLTRAAFVSRGGAPPGPDWCRPSSAAEIDALASLKPLLAMASDELSLACTRPSRILLFSTQPSKKAMTIDSSRVSDTTRSCNEPRQVPGSSRTARPKRRAPPVNFETRIYYFPVVLSRTGFVTHPAHG